MKSLLRWGARCLAVTAAAWSAGCAPVPVSVPEGAGLFVDHAFAPPSRPVDPAEVFALSPAMRQYLRTQSPFTSFHRGQKAYEAGDYAQAKAQFERALAVSNDFHEFHYWMALACLRLGEQARALKHLRAAEQNSVTRQQQAAYAMKLQRLGAGREAR